METKAHYVLVGFFAIALAAAAALFAVWLGRVSFDQEFETYTVEFQGPVRGLQVQAPVRFNGIDVGQVTELGISENDPSMVIALIRVDAVTPLRTTSIARLEPQGLTGLSFIQMSAGDQQSPLLRTVRPRPVIQSERAAVDSLLQDSESLVSDATDVAQALRVIFDDQTVAEVRRTISNLSQIAESLRAEGTLTTRARDAVARLETAAAELEDAGKNVSTAALSLDTLMKNEVTTMLRETEAASVAVNQASAETLGLMEDIREPITRFSETGLEEVTLTVAELRRLAASLDDLVEELEDDPAAFVAGSRRDEVEIPR